ncbi:VOC family protein [Actinophytocola sp.]|uniref:VOC family protein n=1 Tax=Actinophytocola sp. TaxID=1872138 RepID=UPI002EDA6F98
MLGYYAVHAPDTARAKDFYHAVLGWTYASDNDYHHIEGSSPAGGIATGEAGIEPWFVVRDIHAATAKARELGGTAEEPEKSNSGWGAHVEDGHGGTLAIWQPADGHTDDNPKCAVGDLFYFVQPVANDDARAFHTTLLGWELTPGTHEGGYNIVDIAPPGGLFVSKAGPTDVYFRVADVDAAAERIRAAGGTAGPTQPNQVGQHAACRDDQGVSFSIGSLRES